MKKSIVLIALLALVAVPAAAADKAAPADSAQKVHALILEKFGDDAKSIQVALVKGKIVLTGEVTERSTQELCKEVALSVPGVKKVDNQVVAKKEKSLTGGKIGEEAADQKLELEVEKRVKAEIGASYKKVEIEVVDGVAVIRGTVPDETRRQLALKAMQGTEGVKKVIDVLHIKK